MQQVYRKKIFLTITAMPTFFPSLRKKGNKIVELASKVFANISVDISQLLLQAIIFRNHHYLKK